MEDGSRPKAGPDVAEQEVGTPGPHSGVDKGQTETLQTKVSESWVPGQPGQGAGLPADSRDESLYGTHGATQERVLRARGQDSGALPPVLALPAAALLPYPHLTA